MAAEDMPADAKWQNIRWRIGTTALFVEAGVRLIPANYS
jgi:hypothetical protein